MSDTAEDERLSQLIERSQIGDPAAFDEIIRTVEGPLLGFARARGATDPDGLINEVLLRAFRGILVFEGTAPQFRAWIFRIARNLLIDERRHAQRRPDEVPFEPLRLPESGHAPAIDHMDEAERVTTMLEGLPLEQREVLLLRIVGGLDVQEVAEVLDKRPGAIRALQHRGLTRLRRELLTEP
jgi:RNA polymerase sigma-70 factor (ECF subfamily)